MNLKVVGIVESPRKGMNTDTLVTKVLESSQSVGAHFSAQLKLLIDRSNCLTEMIELSGGRIIFKSRIKKKKKGIFIWVTDFSRNPEHALAIIRLWCKDANVELIETLIVTDSDRGKGARIRAHLLQKAFELGVLLGQ